MKLLEPFTAGLHRLDDLWIYVSRGTGYWGPPKRFGAPSEITHLRLVPAASNDHTSNDKRVAGQLPSVKSRQA